VGEAEKVKEDTVIFPIEQPHSMGACPILPIRCSDGLWAAERLESPILKLFNAEANAFYWTMCIANQLLMAPDINNIPRKVKGGADDVMIGKLEWISPHAEGWNMIQWQIEKSEQALHGALNALAQVHQAGMTQHARQPIGSVELDREPMSLWCREFASALKNVYGRAAVMIHSLRKDAGYIEVQGLMRLNASDLQSRLNQLLQLQSLADYPAEAMRWQIYEYWCATNPDAPEDIREKVLEELGFDKSALEVHNDRLKELARSLGNVGQPGTQGGGEGGAGPGSKPKPLPGVQGHDASGRFAPKPKA
jgi:hypothetical protein